MVDRPATVRCSSEHRPSSRSGALAARLIVGPSPRLSLFGLAALCLMCAVYVAHILLGVGGRDDQLWGVWVYEAIGLLAAAICLWRSFVGRNRRVWAAFGLAILLANIGDIYAGRVLQTMQNPPYPSWADAAYLASYVPLCTGVIMLIRVRAPKVSSPSLWLEAAVGALAASAVAAAFLFDPLVAGTRGKAPQVMTTLAYPTFDVALLALLGGCIVLLSHHAARKVALVALGLLICAVGDAVFLLQLAHGTYTAHSLINITWPLSYTIISCSAWLHYQKPASATPRRERAAALVLPALFALMIAGVLALDAVKPIPLVAHILLGAAVLALLARMALAAHEQRQLASSRVEALTDEMTGLHNRRSLYRILNEALTTDRRAALLLLDLNNFKEINDTLGHTTGDKALCQLSERLQSALEDGGLLARLGGDEFVVFLPGAERHAALKATKRLQDALTEPFQIGDLLIPMSASVGVALCPEHATGRTQLLRCADVAMYHAKSHHSGSEIYRPTTDTHSIDRLLLMSELRAAFGTEQLVLHYQPQVSLADGSFVGAEALIRWKHPRLGMVPPDEFVALAETEGLIRLLTLDVIDRPLAQQARWLKAGHRIPVAVNLSPANLLDTRLPDDIAEALKRHGMPGEMLELEITEGMLMTDPERALDTIARIGELGVEFALDDFGVGYSSLAQLKDLPVRTLKIDRSFITNIAENESDASLVQMIIEMSRLLHLKTVAEGVENSQQLQALQQYGCSIAQGYLLSRPIPAQDLPGWLCERHLSPGRPEFAGEDIR